MQYALQQARDVIDEQMNAVEKPSGQKSASSSSLGESLSAPRIPCHLVEWCCERDSDLTRWVIRHGGGATRLCLPQHDVRLDHQVEQ
eukprot:3863254-Heterocapsa_arctica.AAC.1